jgi:hypothetical protein
MRFAARMLFFAALLLTGAAAQARVFNQAELDALLAPIALYPDPLLSSILEAAAYPDQVAEAARWSRANPQLQGDDAVRALEPVPWHPSVKALVAFPEVLARMEESPDWLRDLGEANAVHGPYIMQTIQQLRQRAQASGNLQSTDQQRVYQDGGNIVVQSLYPNVVYVPYYDPFVVYGAWWWPAYRPVFWRPWPVRRVFISAGFFPSNCDWHRRQIVVVNRPARVHAAPALSTPARQWRSDMQPRVWNGTPSPAVRMQQQHFQRVAEPRRQQFVHDRPAMPRVPQSQRQPFMQSRQAMVHSAPRPFRVESRQQFTRQAQQSGRGGHGHRG